MRYNAGMVSAALIARLRHKIRRKLRTRPLLCDLDEDGDVVLLLRPVAADALVRRLVGRCPGLVPRMLPEAAGGWMWAAFVDEDTARLVVGLYLPPHDLWAVLGALR